MKPLSTDMELVKQMRPRKNNVYSINLNANFMRISKIYAQNLSSTLLTQLYS